MKKLQDEESDVGCVHSTLGFLVGVLKSIRITGNHVFDHKESLEKVMKDVDRGLSRYEQYKEARK